MTDVLSVIPLINPKEIKLVDRKGKERIYIISEIDAVKSREIVAQYPTSALPKVGDYELNERMMFEIMSYVAVPMKTGAPLRLIGRDVVRNHVPDLKTLSALEIEMARYNWDFFLPDDLSSFWGRIKKILLSFVQEISTTSSLQSSQTEKQPTTSSDQSTA